jgi:hypothetical protein
MALQNLLLRSSFVNSARPLLNTISSARTTFLQTPSMFRLQLFLPTLDNDVSSTLPVRYCSYDCYAVPLLGIADLLICCFTTAD